MSHPHTATKPVVASTEHNQEQKKMSDTSAYFTGPISGQLYVKFLAFEGLATTFTSTHRPAVSLEVENEHEHHEYWKWNPKKLNQVNEFLIFMKSRASYVRVTFRCPKEHKELGSVLIEPALLPTTQLSTMWVKLGEHARVLIHAYWSALLPTQHFSHRPHELGESTFTLLLDRPQYLAGETVAGVIIYRPLHGIHKHDDKHHHGEKHEKHHHTTHSHPVRSVNLQIAGWSRQAADGDYPDESRHIFFNHEAILIGNSNQGTNTTAVAPAQSEYYIWTFNFPLPYALPPSGTSCGNFYFLHAREVGHEGKTARSARLHFGVRRVVFPREMLAPAIDAPTTATVHRPDGTTTTVPSVAPATTAALPAGGHVLTPAALPPGHTITATIKPLSAAEVYEDEALAAVRDAPEMIKILDEEDSFSDNEHTTRRRKRHHKKSMKKTSGKDGAHRVHHHDDLDDSASSSIDSSDDSGDEGYRHPKARRTHRVDHNGLDHRTPHHNQAGHPIAVAQHEPMVATSPAAAAPTAISAGEATDGSTAAVKAPVVAGAHIATADDGHINHKATHPLGAPAPGANIARVPLRVNPTLTMAPQPSSGRKQLIVPVEIENTTRKPLQYFNISLNYIVERTYRHASLSGNKVKEYSHFARYHVKKFRFKNEAGWPLDAGKKWAGVVTLLLPEDAAPSIDKVTSPLFSRTYYVKIHAANHRHFSRQRVAKRIFLLLGDYDYNTRPLPIQHAHDTPIRFTIFTLPCGAAAPTFGALSTTPAHQPFAAPALYNAEQSEVTYLEV